MHQSGHHGRNVGTGAFSRDVADLPLVVPRQETVLHVGDSFELRIGAVAKRIGDASVRMLAYNGSIPGPTLRVKQGSEIVVKVTNDGDVDATVHWHGLRLENRFDGVPHETQKPIPVGGDFTYRVRFPDEGLYWYHPHIREDYTQDMGLYGNIVVEPTDPDYWPLVDREVVLAIDDLSMQDGQVEAYQRSGPDHVAMGRFGNVFLVDGQTDWRLEVGRGEVVRFYLTNTANTRVFDIRIPDATTKLVGGDSGRYERETLVDDVVIAPSERAIVDVLFESDGEAVLEHRTPDDDHRLGAIGVGSKTASSSAAASFASMRRSPELETERARIRDDLEREPDKVLALVAEIVMTMPSGPTTYCCPMHPEIVSEEPGSCPECGMTLVPKAQDLPSQASPRYACPMDPEIVSDEPGRCPKCGMKLLPIDLVPAALELQEPQPETREPLDEATPDAPASHGHTEGGIEWEDTMLEMNRMTDTSNMRWMLVDRQTGRSNAEIDWSFTVGDRVKIRIVNEMDSDHPMHHPIHFHGAGRFLVLSRDGMEEPNLVWKDTVLVKAAEVVDILLDVSNPGLWMAHCHIAEHTEGGMMFSFNVARRTKDVATT